MSYNTAFPHGYNQFDFCQDNSINSSLSENLGQVLFGERVTPSPYLVCFCNVLLRNVFNKFDKKQFKLFEVEHLAIKML